MSLEQNSNNNRTLLQAINSKQSVNNILTLIESDPIAVKQKNSYGEYPLHAACYHDEYGSVIMKLIDLYPMAAQEKDWIGNYPLHIACQHCKTKDVILKLIEIFPDAVAMTNRKCKSKYGDYPLHIACYYCQSVDVIFKLIEIFPDAACHESSFFGQYALHIACAKLPSVEIIRQLVEIYPNALRKRDDLSCYPIYHAIDCDDSLECIKLLEKADSLVLQDKEEHDFNPYRRACKRRRIHVIEYYNQISDIGINKPNTDIGTPLHHVCCWGHHDIIKLMLQHPNININVTNIIGNTALHVLLQKRDFDKECYQTAKTLLQCSNIEVNLRNQQGVSLLHYACESANIEIVKLLLQHPKINVNATNKMNDSALHVTIQEQHFEEGLCFNQIQTVKYLLEIPDIKINARNQHGITALQVACRYRHIDIVAILLQHPNIHINAANNEGDTALHVVIRTVITYDDKVVPIVPLLLHHPLIVIDVKNQEKNTPLDLLQAHMSNFRCRDDYAKRRRQEFAEIKTLLEDYSMKQKWQAYQYLLQDFE